VFGIVAAGGGAYLANRHNETDMVQQAPMAQSPVPTAVTETENAVTTAPAVMSEPVAPTQFVEMPAGRPAPARPAAVRTAPRRQPVEDRAPAAERPQAPQRTSTAPSPSYTPANEPNDPPAAALVDPLDPATPDRGVVQQAPRKTFDELVIPADSVIGLQVETAVSTERAKIEDKVTARVTRDVRVRDEVAIPAGSRAEGSITVVDRGGRLKDQARLGIRFHTIVLADGTRVPINTDTIYREGDSPARESAAKIGGAAVGGAVLGAIFGGKKGAVIGSTVGAAGGGVAVATSEPNPATLPAGSTVTVRMGSPVTVTVER
jgi:hypothetical protein